jgi:uncharacterized protein (DUF302 family)
VILQRSASGFAATMSALLDAITERGLTVFAQIDHAAGARDIGLQLDDEVVVLFGNPRAGTPWMQSDPRIGIELPLRILVWRQGRDAYVGYLDPGDLATAYDVDGQESTLQQMSTLLHTLAAAAAGSAPA